MDEKKFIQDLYAEKTKNDANSITLANALDMITKTVFEESNRFIFELIQNADDSPMIPRIADVKIEIRLLENYLVFSHSGKHFTNDDVRGISNLGSGDSGKTRDSEKTGYKGVGFKSIFNTYDVVYILSNKFTFKFDKNHHAWSGVESHPWQIIPIWFEESELNSEILKTINRQNVTTVIPIHNREQVKKEINEILGDSRIMLFLRHVSRMSFFDGSEQKIRISRDQSPDDLRTISVNGIKKSSWLYKDFIVAVDEELIEKIKLLDKATYPDKLKEAKNIKISLAASIIDDDIKDISDALIYCYLPTKVNYNFNFLINGDFITNAARTSILENDWNAFIFRQIAECKIKWLADLIRDSKYKYQFTKLIRGKFPSVGSSIIKKSYNEGLDSILAETPIIPVQGDESVYSKVSDCIVDSTGFSNEFGADLILSQYNNKHHVANCRIHNQSSLVALGAKVVDKKELCALLSTEKFKKEFSLDFHCNVRLLKFLHQKDNEDTGWSTYLKSVSFLLGEDQLLSPPEKLYFPLAIEETEISKIVNMKFLDKRVFENIQSNDDLIKWISSFGVRKPSELEILRKSVFQMVDDDLVNISNALPIGRFVFRIFNKGNLSGNDCKKLYNLKLLTTKGSMQLPGRCYLSDYYKPDLNLETLFVEGEYVSPQYTTTEELAELSSYKKFFLSMWDHIV